MTAVLTDRPNTQEMVVVHTVFRRLYSDLPGLVRGCASGDTARAAALAGFVTEMLDALENHHTGEDELLWPLLVQRVQPDPAVVLRAEEQHGRVHESMDRLRGLLPQFVASASPADREAAAHTLDTLNAVLFEHLEEEERIILPLVEQHLTAAEWNRLGEHGRASMPKSRLLIQLGWILDTAGPDQGRIILDEMPLAARVAWRLLGRRRFAAEKARVYGTA